MGVQSSEQCFPEASSLVHAHPNPCCSDSGEESPADQESESSSSTRQCLGFESEAALSTTLSSSDYDLLYETIEGFRIECSKERVRSRTKRKSCRSGCNKNGGGKRRENFTAGGRQVCNCAASFAADCAAVCCCPCALLHLFILAFVKVPSVFAKKVFGFAKKKVRTRRKSDHNKAKNEDNDATDDDNMQKSRYYTPPWSPQTSGPLEEALSAKLDSQKIWSEFYAAGHIGFGGLPFEWN